MAVQQTENSQSKPSDSKWRSGIPAFLGNFPCLFSFRSTGTKPVPSTEKKEGASAPTTPLKVKSVTWSQWLSTLWQAPVVSSPIQASSPEALTDQNILNSALKGTEHIQPQLPAAKIKEYILNPAQDSLLKADQMTVFSSTETVSLSKKKIAISKNGDPTKIETLPQAYLSILGPQERAQSLNVFTNIELPSENEISSKINTEVHRAENWNRIEVMIGDVSVIERPEGGNGDYLNLPLFKEQINLLSGKEPSDLQVLEMLTIMNNDHRTGGSEKNFSTGITLTPDTRHPTFQKKSETMTITFSGSTTDQNNPSFIFEYQSGDRLLSAIQVPSLNQQEQQGYRLHPIDNDNIVPLFFKMRRSNQLKYTPPTGDASTDGKISTRLEALSNQQGFYFDPRGTEF